MEAGGLAMRQIPVDQRATRRLPPDYSENGASGDGIDSPTRPGTVVTVAERLSDTDLEAQPRRDVQQSRLPPRNAGRWSSMRRLMSSTEGSV
jgi:hypothetical protein